MNYDPAQVAVLFIHEIIYADKQFKELFNQQVAEKLAEFEQPGLKLDW